MADRSKAERKYLERYAEPEAMLADQLGRWGHALVVPVYGEGDELIEMLRSVPRGPKGTVLVVLVVNGKSIAPAWIHERNRQVEGRIELAFGDRNREDLSGGPPSRLFAFPPGHILFVDRSRPEHWLPDDQGVGLARKIGVDLCVRLHAAGRLASPYIRTTDADALLPSDYFDRPEENVEPAASALLYPFTHVPEKDAALARAVVLYEISLRYYVLGLGSAGSAWAYHTIGSTIATHADAYTKVRGFPKRDAAEDFYLLSKLAKVGPIVSMRGRPIVLAGRPSSRVPFGTGAAVRRIAALGREPFKMYNPLLFRCLAVWLAALNDATGSGSVDFESDLRHRSLSRDLDPRPLLEASAVLDASRAIASAKTRSNGAAALAGHLGVWFDAFRTLKLVHVLQRGGVQPLPWHEALREAPFAASAIANLRHPENADLDELRETCARLDALEGEMGNRARW